MKFNAISECFNFIKNCPSCDQKLSTQDLGRPQKINKEIYYRFKLFGKAKDVYVKDDLTDYLSADYFSHNFSINCIKCRDYGSVFNLIIDKDERWIRLLYQSLKFKNKEDYCEILSQPLRDRIIYNNYSAHYSKNFPYMKLNFLDMAGTISKVTNLLIFT